tara:strand:- start:2283 stop:2477 length:195 start_codon:yes stop_codon:yes gene_type:complete
MKDLEAENKILKDAINDFLELIDNSDGVAGLHLNGEVAEWSTLLEGGNFEEWLINLSRAKGNKL